MSLINDNQTAATPPAAVPAAWPPAPPPYAPPPPPPRRWPGILLGAGAGALIAATAAALITTGLRTTPDTTASTSTTTVTASAPTPAAPAALPTAQADRQTCSGWLDAGKLMDSAESASKPLKGAKLDDPEPSVTSAARQVGDLLGQAANSLESKSTAGSTPVLGAAAGSTVQILRGGAESYLARDTVGAATFDRITNAAAAEMTALCRRLAPLR